MALEDVTKTTLIIIAQKLNKNIIDVGKNGEGAIPTNEKLNKGVIADEITKIITDPTMVFPDDKVFFEDIHLDAMRAIGIDVGKVFKLDPPIEAIVAKIGNDVVQESFAQSKITVENMPVFEIETNKEDKIDEKSLERITGFDPPLTEASCNNCECECKCKEDKDEELVEPVKPKQKSKDKKKRVRITKAEAQKQIDFVVNLIDGTKNRKDIIALTMMEFPGVNKASIGTLLSNALNPKYVNKLGRLVVKDDDGFLNFAD
jgi:hypothetical protein